MFKLKPKKQPFTFTGKLPTDFGLPLQDSRAAHLAPLLEALQQFGVQHAVFAGPPGASAGEAPLPAVAGIHVAAAPSYWLDASLERQARQHALANYHGYVFLALPDWGTVRAAKGPVFELRARGYRPVILHHSPKHFAKVKLTAVEYMADLGCLLQLDVMALTGRYGRAAKSHAEALVKAGCVRLFTTGLCSAGDAGTLATLLLPESVASALEEALVNHRRLLADLSHTL